jgi:hypothetical protein
VEHEFLTITSEILYIKPNYFSLGTVKYNRFCSTYVDKKHTLAFVLQNIKYSNVLYSISWKKITLGWIIPSCIIPLMALTNKLGFNTPLCVIIAL